MFVLTGNTPSYVYIKGREIREEGKDTADGSQSQRRWDVMGSKLQVGELVMSKDCRSSESGEEEADKKWSCGNIWKWKSRRQYCLH